MKKKLAKLSIVVLIAFCVMGCVYAALSCNLTMKLDKTTFDKGEEFTVDIELSNIQSERGIIALGATLQYDTDSLELVAVEGKNGWETPTEGISYNQSNGKIAITRSGLGKNDETVFSLKFKVKETSKQNVVIALNDITVGDGIAPAKIETVSQNITVSGGTATNPPIQEPDTNTNTNTNINTSTNVNTNATTNTNSNSNVNGNTTTNSIRNNVMSTNTTANSALPKAGNATGNILSVFIILAISVSIVLWVKMKATKK